MKKIIRLFLFSLFLLSPLAATPAQASLPVQPAPQSQRASSALTMIDNAIGQQLEALVTNGEADIEPQETFGTRSLGLILAVVDIIRTQSGTAFTNLTAITQVGIWFNQQYNDPIISARWSSIGSLLLLAFFGAIAIDLLFHIMLSSLRKNLTRRRNETFSERLLAGAGWLFLSFIPLLLSVATALILMNGSEPPRLTRYVVMNVIYALTLQQLVRLLVAFLFAPRASNLRLIAVTDTLARYIQRWVARLACVMIYGYFCVDIARVVRVPPSGISAFSNLIGLIIISIAITITHQKRTAVGQFLRGDLSSSMPHHTLTLSQSMRLWLARVWDRLAISYLVIGFTVTTMSNGNGFTLLLQGTILTLILLIVARTLVHAIALMGSNATSHFYRPVMRGLLRLVVWFAAILSIAAAWGVDISAMIATPWGQRITGSAFSISVTILIATLIYETINRSVEHRLNHRDSRGHLLPVSARAQTLLPLARNAALVVLTGIVALMILSEFGVNIAPLLAGAGVIGVAIGFGSQSLVKDFITGLFILLEDSIAIGDCVVIGDLSGVVESMTIRTLRLRALNGDLHILPFGEVAKVTNQTKGFSYAVMEINVSYKEDAQEAMKIFQGIGDALIASEAYSTAILAPMEIFGVTQLTDNAFTVRCRLKTKPGKQWEIQRAFLLRVKEDFQKAGFEIPYPTVRHLTTQTLTTPAEPVASVKPTL